MAKNIIIQCGKGLKLINNINTRLHLYQDNHVNRRLISYLRIFFIQLLGGRKIGYASKISLADFCSLNCGYCKTLLGSLLQRLFFFKQTNATVIFLFAILFCLNYSCIKGGSNWTILSSVKLEVTTPLKITFGTMKCQGSL